MVPILILAIVCVLIIVCLVILASIPRQSILPISQQPDELREVSRPKAMGRQEMLAYVQERVGNGVVVTGSNGAITIKRIESLDPDHMVFQLVEHPDYCQNSAEEIFRDAERKIGYGNIVSYQILQQYGT